MHTCYSPIVVNCWPVC